MYFDHFLPMSNAIKINMDKVSVPGWGEVSTVSVHIIHTHISVLSICGLFLNFSDISVLVYNSIVYPANPYFYFSFLSKHVSHPTHLSVCLFVCHYSISFPLMTPNQAAWVTIMAVPLFWFVWFFWVQILIAPLQLTFLHNNVSNTSFDHVTVQV